MRVLQRSLQKRPNVEAKETYEGAKETYMRVLAKIWSDC
jgi:hypothetical protein